jgi:hypothetical protein
MLMLGLEVSVWDGCVCAYGAEDKGVAHVRNCRKETAATLDRPGYIAVRDFRAKEARNHSAPVGCSCTRRRNVWRILGEQSDSPCPPIVTIQYTETSVDTSDILTEFGTYLRRKCVLVVRN